jgi:protocatechuate 3,4-dioxygenase beta subunit
MFSSGLVLAACGQRATENVLSAATPLASGSAGAGSAPEVAGAQAQSCTASPQVTEGPYFVDERLERSDIRTDPVTGEESAGVPLQLAISTLLAANGACTPLEGAQVDIWHCDAAGVYSDVQDNIMGTRGAGRKFLRGYQVTDPNGSVQFTTIYPGWYQGRAVHIHFKIRTDPASEVGYEFTSQFFFDDALNDYVFTTADPYVARGRSPLPNARDGIYQGTNGVLTLQPSADANGYAAAMTVTLDPTAPAGPVGPGGPGGPPPRRGF